MAPKASREAGGLRGLAPAALTGGVCQAGRAWLQRPGGCRSPNERQVGFSPGTRTHTEHHRFSLWAREISATHPGPAPVISRVPKRTGCRQRQTWAPSAHTQAGPGANPPSRRTWKNRVRIAPAAS